MMSKYWKAEEKADTLDLFSNLPYEIQKKIMQHHEPSTKKEYLEYYGNLLSVKKENRNILDIRVEEKSCKYRPLSVDNIIESITKDIESMKTNINGIWMAA